MLRNAMPLTVLIVVLFVDKIQGVTSSYYWNIIIWRFRFANLTHCRKFQIFLVPTCVFYINSFVANIKLASYPHWTYIEVRIVKHLIIKCCAISVADFSLWDFIFLKMTLLPLRRILTRPPSGCGTHWHTPWSTNT